ncbi:MAG: hypothetical protein Q4G26_12715 [Paracoccus sp. (in: a-proteobacteria)]|nr:hypothetical protein [Paracoccus sp. (in: a-proteobacteria)]
MSRFADVTSDTPHGPRPVPQGHIPADDAPAPRRSLRSSLLLWGGVGLALTVGALAARAAAGAVAEPARPPRPRHAPGFAALDDDQQARMRARARADIADYQDRAAELRAEALRARRRRHRRRPPQNAGFADNIGRAARNIASLIGVAGTALEGFRKVSANSDQIIRDFTRTADQLQGFLATRSTDAPTGADTEKPRSPNERRTRNL